jgi:hypothetical protein
MSNTTVFRFNGPTTAISVSSTSSTAVTITPQRNDQQNFCAFLNTNNFPVAVTVAPADAATAVLPTGGNSSQSFVLGISMTAPMVVAVPSNSFSVTTVCAGASTGTVYITPVGTQS